MGDIGDVEQSGAQRIIEIMRQIGNVIGKIGKLRLRRGKGREFQRQRVKPLIVGRNCALPMIGPLCLATPSSVSQLRFSPSKLA